MTLNSIHAGLSNAILMFSLIAAAWGLVLFLSKRGVAGSYWGIIASAELLYVAQAVIGILLWAQGARPGRGIHILYGVVTILTLPGLYAFTSGRDDRTASLVYALVFLFLTGISLRAIGTAG